MRREFGLAPETAMARIEKLRQLVERPVQGLLTSLCRHYRRCNLRRFADRFGKCFRLLVDGLSFRFPNASQLLQRIDKLRAREIGFRHPWSTVRR